MITETECKLSTIISIKTLKNDENTIKNVAHAKLLMEIRDAFAHGMLTEYIKKNFEIEETYDTN